MNDFEFNEEQLCAADFNQDGIINEADTNLLSDFLLGVFEVPGCTDETALNYNPGANIDEGNCEYFIEVLGCTDPLALNYNLSANTDDGGCEYSSVECLLGDVTLDGAINILDHVDLIGYIYEEIEFNEEQLCAADFNEDGVIDLLDAEDLIDFIL